jgi:predicted ArsR family transcriptional regulator
MKSAPVEIDAILAYLTRTRRIDTTRGDVLDRLNYLVSKGFLEFREEWDRGRKLTHYRCSARGMDLLDGLLDPDYWKEKN